MNIESFKSSLGNHLNIFMAKGNFSDTPMLLRCYDVKLAGAVEVIAVNLIIKAPAKLASHPDSLPFKLFLAAGNNSTIHDTVASLFEKQIIREDYVRYYYNPIAMNDSNGSSSSAANSLQKCEMLIHFDSDLEQMLERIHMSESADKKAYRKEEVCVLL